MKLLTMMVLCAAMLVGLAGCPSKNRGESIKLSNECVKAYGQKQFEVAIEKCTKSTERWRDNHIAWYALAGSWIGRQDWSKAADAMQSALQVAREQPMD